MRRVNALKGLGSDYVTGVGRWEALKKTDRQTDRRADGYCDSMTESVIFPDS